MVQGQQTQRVHLGVTFGVLPPATSAAHTVFLSVLRLAACEQGWARLRTSAANTSRLGPDVAGPGPKAADADSETLIAASPLPHHLDCNFAVRKSELIKQIQTATLSGENTGTPLAFRWQGAAAGKTVASVAPALRRAVGGLPAPAAAPQRDALRAAPRLAAGPTAGRAARQPQALHILNAGARKRPILLLLF